MTLGEALRLGKGDLVTHPATNVRREPLRVTEVWVNEAETIVQIRLASIAGNAWLDALGYDRAPAGHVWCKGHKVWELKAEHRRLHPEAYAKR